MFGKPAWFREQQLGWGLFPVAWQGWAIGGAWMAAMLGPCLLLLALGKNCEAIVWLIAMLSGVFAEIRSIKQALRNSTKPVESALYSSDSGSQAETRNFDLHLRR